MTDTPQIDRRMLEAPSLITRRETLITLIEYSLRSGGEAIVQ